MIQIKVAAYQNVATGEASPHELSMMDWEDEGETVESLITMTDHLASHAFYEEKERALFEARFGKLYDLAFNDEIGEYEDEGDQSLWYGWKACARSRAKSAGCL